MRFARLQLGGTLDRYVGGLFLGAYMTSLLLIIGLSVILDVASHLDYFEPWDDGSTAPFGMIARYYALNIPFLFVQVAPFVTVSAGLFTLSKLVRYSELIAGLNAGLSMQRVVTPIFAGALFATGTMFFIGEVATERLGEPRDSLRYMLDKHKYQRELEDLWFRDERLNVVRIARFKPAQAGVPRPEATGLEVAIQSGATIRIATADRAIWDDATWRLENGVLRDETGSEAKTTPIETLEGLIEFTPDDVLLAEKGFDRPLELSFTEVSQLMAGDPDNLQYQTLMQYHLTFPLANVVLLLVTLPFLVGRDRGRNFEGVAIACSMCVLFFAFDFVSRSLGMDGSLSPLIASWLPLLFFGSLGAVLFETAKA